MPLLQLQEVSRIIIPMVTGDSNNNALAYGQKGKVNVMKTIEELYKEINESEELKKTASEIKDKVALSDFLKQHGCEASVEEFAKFIKSQGEGEIGDDAASAVAGGWPDWANPTKWFN